VRSAAGYTVEKAVADWLDDSWIAACCLPHRFPLATSNAKDFEDFAEHDNLPLFAPGAVITMCQPRYR
jgi:hypothetical protein